MIARWPRIFLTTLGLLTTATSAESATDAWAPRDTYPTEMKCRQATVDRNGALSPEYRKVNSAAQT
jgi:hypothetical protein